MSKRQTKFDRVIVMRLLIGLGIGLGLGSASAKGEAKSPALPAIKKAIDKAQPLIESSSAKYLEERKCFSCHHQGMAMVVLPELRRRGFKINKENLGLQIERTNLHLRQGKSRYLSGKGTGGQVDTAGQALLSLQANGHKPDELTAAVVQYFLLRDKGNDHWKSSSNRPPTQGSKVTATYLAIVAFDGYATKEQQDAVAKRKEKARQWMLQVSVKDTEDHVSRLRALHALGEMNEHIDNAAAALLKLQRSDGGWAQLSTLESDAYATATALVALQKTGALSADSAAYRRGLTFLLDTQLKDGSWHVKTRSRPIQTYFESGFPHGKDQFISMSATCWSTMALALACPLSP